MFLMKVYVQIQRYHVLNDDFIQLTKYVEAALREQDLELTVSNVDNGVIHAALPK